MKNYPPLYTFVIVFVLLLSCNKESYVKISSSNDRSESVQIVPAYCANLPNPCTDPVCAQYFNCSINDTWSFTDPQTSKKVTCSFKMTAVAGDTTLSTKVLLYSQSNALIIDYGEIILKSNNVLKADSLSKILKKNFTTLKNKYGISKLQANGDVVSKMVASKGNALSDAELKTFKFQSLCMFNTLAKAAFRNTGTISPPFTPMESYLNSLNSFSVEEDELINTAGFKAWLSNQDTSRQGVTYYLNALANETAVQLSVYEITLRLNTYFSSIPTSLVFWPRASQCGCCGNYSGACLYWNKICLIHDYQCQSCTPSWYCFNGCVKGSCSGNTIGWQWWFI